MESTNNLVTSSINNLALKDGVQKTFKEMTMKEKLSYIRSVITVEPLLIFYYIPTFICGPALWNLQLEKSCRVNANYNDTVCKAILSASFQNYTHENDNVQAIITTMQVWQNPLQNIVPLILILFLASYSDRHKIRKPFLLLPILGEFFAIAGCFLCVIFMDQIPVEFQGFSQTIFPSFLGGPATLIMAIFAYISDISTMEMRTLRIGIIQIILTACSMLSALGGYLFTKIGYYGVLSMGGASFLIALIYGYFYIEETNTEKVKYQSVKGFLDDVFNPKHAIETFQLLRKPQQRTNVKLLYLVIIVFFISGLVVIGEVSVFWLFAQHAYMYTPVKFSYYDSIRNSLVVVGSLIFLPLFTKVLKLHDSMIVVITFIDKIVSNLLLIFVLNEIGLYVATTVANCATIGNTALKSMATKSVQISDLAKALSLLALCETLSGMAAPSLYSALYQETLATHPTVFLYVGVGLFSASVILILCLYICYKQMFKFDIYAKETNGVFQDKYQQTTKL
ncbi:probable peptidoglycan muropeptide transporter SLC46 [Onthophagus taurus]|uniref:probable peptidoglycan muropeptide transporter SLC46 n=1 Tax=Onthophagus taurus TaxID=166361 RepID=UPI000C2023AE|nr:uncharacterized protein LOC111414140 [Onthophagus taurus]